MFQRLKACSLGLAILLATAGVGGCGPVPDDPECIELREFGLSEERTTRVRGWIESVLADPAHLAATGRTSGTILARRFQSGPDWNGMRIPPDNLYIEFDGAGVDYAHLVRSDVESVIISRGFGYKLIFKLDPNTDIEQRLLEESRKPYGEVKIESLGPDLVLVCQVNSFG